MRYVGDIRFWLMTAFCIAAIGVLISSVRLKGKGWLLGFLILSLLSYAGFYVPSLLLRNGMLTNDTFRKFADSVGLIFHLFSVAGWAMLIAFVFSLRAVEQSSGLNAGAGAATGGSPPPLQPDSPYSGYGGWLAFFGAVQLFVAPILAVVMVVLGAVAVSDAAGRYPTLMAVFSLETLGSFAVVGLGMYAAIQLRRIRPGAVRVTTLYLFAGLTWSVLAFALPYIGAIPDSARDAMTAENVKGFVRTLIPFTIWLSYFNVSKRVKATYLQG